MPIVIGPCYEKHKEVVDLVKLKGCKVVANQNEFSAIFTRLKESKAHRMEMGDINATFIKENIGATEVIMKYIKTNLN